MMNFESTLKPKSVIGMETVNVWLIWSMVGLLSQDLSFLSLSGEGNVTG